MDTEEKLKFFDYIKKDTDMPDLPKEEERELWERIGHLNRQSDRRRLRRLPTIVAAAAVCLLLVAGRYAFYDKADDEVDYVALMQETEQHDERTADKIQLILSDNKKISIDGKEAKVIYGKTGRVSINDHIDLEELAGKEKEVYNRLVVPENKRSLITLGDGTKLWVNSSTRVLYPVAFRPDRREIYVEGEIYLEVSRDEARPFIVKTGQVDIRVLGTSFNVSAPADEPDLQVVLVDGRVEIVREGKEADVLSPNQLFSYNRQTERRLISSVDVMDYIAWKDGYYTFSRQFLSVVLGKLGKYYGVRFTWDDRIKLMTCSGKLDLKDDLSEVLKTLERTAPIIIGRTEENVYTIHVKP
ncbi:MAG: FecR domain-containing protein [Tannerellaceae bacterium]|jgi:ferric-dicitrate binding protein FerR (iron transport regulator)|nr:FecR domain-containing protein [Tannerellaceae bacterium]